ncbi:MAG: UvrB/UvrC motif-containing protein [Gemmataceae bacterium]|nr:UvrB/UvrC motif-containing protein [Gemmataceae bacterium]
MKCQSCSSPATVHLTDIVNGHKRVTHLCSACAEKQQLVKHQELNLSAILQSVITPHLAPSGDEASRLVCPACGIKYMEFKAGGRLGCPHDYTVFRTVLVPLLERIHRAAQHIGKVPRHSRRTLERQAEVIELRRELRRAVEAEAYEEAARLRDLLRQKEAADEPR